MTARFSVFVPLWNDTRFLPGMIESLLAQTHQDWELVIGDNVSTEDVAAVLAAYPDERIRHHRWSTHVDFASNANRTITLGRYEWLQYLSADDRLDPRCLAAMAAAVDAADAAGDPLVAVLTGCGRYDQDGKFLEDQPFFKTWRVKTLPTGTYDAAAFLRHCAAPGATPWNIGSFAISRTTLDVMGGYFREEVGFAPDLEVAARAAAYGPTGYVAEPLLQYTVRGDSISRGLAIRNLERGELLPPVPAAIMSALAVHEHRRTVSAAERRYLREQVADGLIARALRHRYREGGRGWRAAIADLRRAAGFSMRWLISPRQLARAAAAALAPRWLLARLFEVFRGRGVYV
jgi:glycosyltransferase involved in cell wall biosynthesis